MIINACLMPTPIVGKEAEIYKRLRTICDKNRKSHDCSGRLIIDRNGITLACPLCGDARKTYPEAT